MVTLLCTHGHPSLHSWSPFSALMVTLLCTHVTLLYTQYNDHEVLIYMVIVLVFALVTILKAKQNQVKV